MAADNKLNPPNSLHDYPMFGIEVTRGTKAVILHLPDDQTFSLGNYFDSETNRVVPVRNEEGEVTGHERIEGARVYLQRVFGDERLIDRLLTTANNFGHAIYDIESGLVRSYDANEPHEMRRMFDKVVYGSEYEDFIGTDRPRNLVILRGD